MRWACACGCGNVLTGSRGQCDADDGLAGRAMQRGRPTVASVLLCFVCMITASSKFCSRDLFTGVSQLLQEAPKKSLNCSLYTPTIKDYEEAKPSWLIASGVREP